MTNLYQTILRYLNEEPVAVGASVIAALVVIVSLVTGVPVESVVAQVVAILGVFATVRASVTPFLVTDEEEYDGPVTPEEAAAYFPELEPTEEDYDTDQLPLFPHDEGTNPPR